MKRVVLVFFLICLSATVFGQQFLWSTVKDSKWKYVPMDSVTIEVMNYYDHYRYHFDGAGFDKDGLVKFLEEFTGKGEESKQKWNWMYSIETSTVFALRNNEGHGSMVIVMCISKENVNTIGFFNAFEKDAIANTPSGRKKFIKWFKTLLN